VCSISPQPKTKQKFPSQFIVRAGLIYDDFAYDDISVCNWKAIVKKALMQQKLPLLKIIQLFRPLKVTRLVNNLYPSMDM
jgi:hypothetical protein